MFLTVLLLVALAQTCSQHNVHNKSIKSQLEIETFLFTTQDCVMFPCYKSHGSPEACEHAVGIPENIRTRDGNSSHCSELQAVTIEWNPSPYGIEFVQGFQVDLTSLSGMSRVSKCRQLDIRDGVRLEPDLIIGITLCLGSDTQYRAVDYGFPIPSGQESSAQEIQFSTKSSYPNVRQANPSAWPPSRMSFTQDGHNVTVSFTSAAETDNVKAYYIYHGLCRPGEPTPHTWQHIHVLHDGVGTVQVRLGRLEPGFNYSVMILSDQEGAERQEATYFVKSEQTGEGQEFTLTLLLVHFAVILIIVTIMDDHLIYNRKQNGTQDGEADVGDGYMSEPFSPHRVSNPRVFLLYPDTASPRLLNVVLHFATFLQTHCACQVVLDMWEELARGREGLVAWTARQLSEAHFIVVMCWPGGSPGPGWEGAAYSLGLSLVAEQLLQARISSSGLSRFIVAGFGHCGEADVPGVLGLGSKYQLMEALPRLFSHLRSLKLLGPGLALHVDGISEETYPTTPSGFALYQALRLAGEDGSLGSAILY